MPDEPDDRAEARRLLAESQRLFERWESSYPPLPPHEIAYRRVSHLRQMAVVHALLARDDRD